jgi:hypothetical protein
VPPVTSPGSSSWTGPAAGTGGGQVPPAPQNPTTLGAGADAAAAAGAAATGSGQAQPPPSTQPGPQPNPPSGNVQGRGAGRQNLLGWLSLSFSIIGTGCCCCPWLDGAPFVGGIPAVVLGVLHLNKVKKGQASMAWLGWVGIILGAIALIGGITAIATDWPQRLENEYNDMTNN